LAPAGYFLFNVVNAGIPSPAVWIHIGWKLLSVYSGQLHAATATVTTPTFHCTRALHRSPS
jgi:hypothetical protein